MMCKCLTFPQVLAVVCFSMVDDARAVEELMWVGVGRGIGALTEERHVAVAEHETWNSKYLSSKLALGLYMTPNLAIFGQVDTQDGDRETLNIASVGLQGREFIWEDLSGYAKLGAVYLFDGDHSNGPSGLVGVGLDYKVNANVSVQTGVDYFHRFYFDSDAQGELTQFYVGMTYRFTERASVEPKVIEKPVEVVKEVVKEVEVTKEVMVPAKPIIISDADDQLFEINSSILHSTSAFEGVLQQLQSNPDWNLELIGHTDSSGPAHYNQWLSEKRAHVVAAYFVSHDIDASRITVSGKGEMEPFTSNETPEGRALNRRVELTLIPEE